MIDLEEIAKVKGQNHKNLIEINKLIYEVEHYKNDLEERQVIHPG